jgi:ribosomal protein L16/L10AE
MNNLINKINTTKLESCNYCIERWFNDGGKKWMVILMYVKNVYRRTSSA